MAQEQILEGFHLSPQQKRLFQEPRQGPELVSQAVVRLEGAVEPSRLREAIEGLARRHEILRTRFERLPGMETPLQVIGEEPLAAWIEEPPAPGDGTGARERAVALARSERAEVVAGAAGAAGDAGTTLRSVWVDGGDGTGYLVLTLPSVVADGRSLEVLVDELAVLYAGSPSGGPAAEEPLQYLQFSEWLNELIEDPESEPGRRFWAQREGDGGGPIRLPWEPSEPAGGKGEGWSIHRFELPGDFVERGRRVASAAGCGLRELLLAVWGSLLGRLAGAAEVPVELGADGRRFEELDGAVGPFAIDLPAVVRPPVDRPFRDELRRLGGWLREVAEWSELVLAPREDDGDHEAGGKVGFELEEASPARRSGGVSFEVVARYHARRSLGLRLVATPRDGCLGLDLHADPSRHGTAELERLGRYFGILAEAAVDRPERPLGGVELIDREEGETLARWNATELPRGGPEQLVEALAAQVAATPDRIAVVAPDGHLSFRELDRRAALLAGHLGRLGVGADSRVGVFLERSADQMVAVWGVLRAGAAYLPLDTFQPASRLRSILDDAGAEVMVSELPLRGRWPEDGDDGGGDGDVAVTTVAIDGDWSRIEAREPAAAGTAPRPRNLAYVLYTSGSTGEPKGVLVEHRSVLHLSRSLARGPYAELEGELRVAVNAPLAFDASVKQVIQLLRGHTLVLVPEETRTDGEALAAWLAERRPDVLDATPSHLRLLVAAGLIPGEGAGDAGVAVPRLLLIGGEAIDGELWRTLARDPGRTAFNLYGPTECTVDSTAGAVSADAGPSIGGPLGNVRTWILDRWLARLPVGVAGELCVAGDGVARGYLGRPARTAASFVPDPFAPEPGGRLYRTGDRARWRPGGRVEFLGRIDRQVKLRGVRLELGEVEAALLRSPKVLEALAHLRDLHGEPQLVAYVVPRRRYAPRVEGRPRHVLPNGLAVVQQNRNETDYLYEEIFAKRCYLQHGISLPDDACVLDVGANVGMFTLQVLQECSRPRIYAFEPLPAMLETLRLNVDLYAPAGSVQSYGFGLSDAPRVERFTFYPRYTMMSGAADHARPEAEVEVVKRFLENQRRRGDEEAAELIAEAEELLAGRFAGEEVECELRRLSEVISEIGIERVDLLKIDVQRAELEVLRGIDDDHWERIDQVVMEVHDAAGEATEGRTREIAELLESRGFTTVVEQDELLIGTDRYNLYAVRPASRRRPAGGGPDGVDPDGGLLTVDELRELLRRRLPEYAVPAAVVMLDDFPLNRNGKVDLAALPAPDEVASGAGEDAAPPRTPYEEVLVGIWGEILGIDRPGVDRSFFELGGHSLLATQLMSRVRQLFQVELPLRVLFDAPTVTELAARIETALAGAEAGAEPPIEPVPRTAPLPLSFAQQRLWFVQQIDPRSPAYNYPIGLRLRGRLHVAALERTFGELVRRHEVLRTRFPADGPEPVQVIDPPAPVPLPGVDLGGLAEDRREAELERLRSEEARRPVELAAGPVFRVTLLRLAPEDHVVLATLHHVVTDGWSTSILTREVSALYGAYSQGRTPDLPELPVQYADFAVWQRRWLQGAVLEEQLGYWRRQLAGMPDALELPADRERPARPSFQGGGHSFRFPVELSRALEELGRAEGVTLFMTLLAGFQALLHRWTGQSDVVVGTDVANRNRSEIEGLIGFFVNNLVLRTDLSGNPTFRELLARVREVTLGAYAHQDLPFDLLVTELQPRRQLARTPLFQVLFVLQNVPTPELEIPGLRLSPMAGNLGSAKFDLAVFVNRTEEGIFGAWNYSTDLFDASTVARLSAQYQTLLASSIENPDERIQRLEVMEMETTKSRESKIRRLRGSRRRSSGGSSAELVETGFPVEDVSLPLMIRPRMRDLDLAGWAGSHRQWIEEKLLRHGALLFRGFGVDAVPEFESFARAVCPTLYGEYGDLPREEEGEKVYHSTPYPADKAILFHNESSHMHRWPMRQFFCCLQVAPEGGETPIVDCREIYRRLDPAVVERFADEKLQYVRNFVEGFDVSWRDFFHTEDRGEVERYCRERGIEFHWHEDGLEIRQVAPAVARHPQTGEMVFFNQIQLHHPSCLDPEERESLRSIFGDDRLPRSVSYGDGTPIEDSLVAEITALYWDCSVAAPWQPGDVVMVDNMLCAHARNPFSGPRKVVVAMGEIRRADEIDGV